MNKKGLLSVKILAGLVIVTLGYQNITLEQQLNQINNDLEGIVSDKNDLRLNLTNLSEQKENLIVQFEHLKVENEELYSQLEILEEENKDLKKQYANMKNNSSNMLAISEADKMLIAQLIYSEARGESQKGKQAVANVVLNRMKDSRFPNTVQETIHQPRQFVESAILHTYPVIPSALEAIEKALDEDVTNGAFFFWAPRIATCRWLETRTVTTVIGGHQFLK